ncbi:MDR family MFS transporter [Marininema halotolerans]|uniref:Predicted arabinose efflux permease, MFS family n=1 Tax=Marininema halotolerans TaxID=1155944 RepID=A0A1I6RD69_9BACL|nr:MFS transporter [Marininema halotolerans]SFS62595.1 Predicted arabinose efflux permease, MFS family [Marininema halotolerans]
MNRLRALYIQYHPMIWILMGGTVFARAASFMSYPFLAIYLSRVSSLEPWLIGLILGIGALAGTVGGFIGGNLSDRFGRMIVMVVTLFVWAGVYVGFSLAKGVWVFLILNLLNGLCRSFFEPTSQALMADLTPKEKRMRVFGIRYMAINIGAAVGPLLGAWLAMISGSLTFFITGMAYLIYGVLLVMVTSRYKEDLSPKSKVERVRFLEVIGVMRRDVALGWFIIGGLISNIGYSQMQSNLPLYVEQLFGSESKLYSILLAINALTVIVFQAVITRRAEKRPLLSNMIIGSLLFSVGLLLFAGGQVMGLLYIGIFVFTVGEILLFLSSSLFVDGLAKTGMRGSYFGASGFQALGFFIGPSLGGWFLSQWGGGWAFVMLAVISGSGIFFYWKGQRAFMKRKEKVVPPIKEKVQAF